MAYLHKLGADLQKDTGSGGAGSNQDRNSRGSEQGSNSNRNAIIVVGVVILVLVAAVISWSTGLFSSRSQGELDQKSGNADSNGSILTSNGPKSGLDDAASSDEGNAAQGKRKRNSGLPLPVSAGTDVGGAGNTQQQEAR